MIFAQFYQHSATDPNTLVKACGDRSVVSIDDQLERRTIGRIAAEECAKRGYTAWRIFEGESIIQSHPVSKLWHVPDGNPANDMAWLRADD
jgi:hypothetical protein